MKSFILMLTCSVSFLFAQADDIYDVLIPLNENDYYRQKLKNKTLPDFVSKIDLKGLNYTFLGFTGGSHAGILYIVPQDGRPHALNTGPIYSIVSNEVASFLKADEIFVLTSTGGTGVHLIIGLILKITKDTVQILAQIPMSGYDANQQGNIPEDLQSKNINPVINFSMNHVYQKNTATIFEGELVYDLSGFSKKDQKRILKNGKFKTQKETFTLKLMPTGITHLDSSQGVKDILEPYIVDASKAEKLGNDYQLVSKP